MSDNEKKTIIETKVTQEIVEIDGVKHVKEIKEVKEIRYIDGKPCEENTHEQAQMETNEGVSQVSSISEESQAKSSFEKENYDDNDSYKYDYDKYDSYKDNGVEPAASSTAKKKNKSYKPRSAFRLILGNAQFIQSYFCLSFLLVATVVKIMFKTGNEASLGFIVFRALFYIIISLCTLKLGKKCINEGNKIKQHKFDPDKDVERIREIVLAGKTLPVLSIIVFGVAVFLGMGARVPLAFDLTFVVIYLGSMIFASFARRSLKRECEKDNLANSESSLVGSQVLEVIGASFILILLFVLMSFVFGILWGSFVFIVSWLKVGTII